MPSYARAWGIVAFFLFWLDREPEGESVCVMCGSRCGKVQVESLVSKGMGALLSVLLAPASWQLISGAQRCRSWCRLAGDFQFLP